MKKMFVAFGIAIAVICGTVFSSSQTAQAAEIYTEDEINYVIEECLSNEIANYSEEYDEAGITNVKVFNVMSVIHDDGSVFVIVTCSAEYNGKKVYETQSTVTSMSEVAEVSEAYGL